MSSIDFKALTSDRPELADAAGVVESWLDDHPRVKALDPERLVREQRDLALPYVAELFRELEERGEVEGTFRLRRDGVLIGGDFDDPNLIPDFIEDITGESVSTDQCEVILVFKVHRNRD